jgi:hypothetical protein
MNYRGGKKDDDSGGNMPAIQRSKGQEKADYDSGRLERHHERRNLESVGRLWMFGCIGA